jgi:hypothetical protein
MQFLEREEGKISYEDSDENEISQSHPICICVPGIGDLRSQVIYRIDRFLIRSVSIFSTIIITVWI